MAVHAGKERAYEGFSIVIRVLYFASLRERVGRDTEEIALDAATNVGTLRDRLAARGEIWADALGDGARVLAAVNRRHATRDTSIADGDEVAFFPPVTGG